MKTFPVLNSGGKTIPWDAVEPHREQAERNHNQPLEQIAERGGLCWKEMYYVLTDTDFPLVKHDQVDYRRLVLDLVVRADLVKGAAVCG